jgi:hypothetical protein
VRIELQLSVDPESASKRTTSVASVIVQSELAAFVIARYVASRRHK